MKSFQTWKKGKTVKGFYSGETGIIDNVFIGDTKTNPVIKIKRKNGQTYGTLNMFVSMGYEIVT